MSIRTQILITLLITAIMIATAYSLGVVEGQAQGIRFSRCFVFDGGTRAECSQHFSSWSR